MSYTYTSLVSAVANFMPVASSDANFQSMIPNMIDDVEQRMYRELDLVNTSTQRDYSASATAGTRDFNYPSQLGTYVITQQINVVTPVGSLTPNAGTRNQVIPTTLETLDLLFPASSYSSVPQYFALTSQTALVFGPAPDQNYMIEVVGTIRPPALSSTVTTTLLTVFLPDVFFAGCMAFAAAYMKNFGAAVDDPKAGVTWEGHFQQLMQSAGEEENRKKFSMQGWSSEQPNKDSTPPRT
jgi:hypothetical protein